MQASLERFFAKTAPPPDQGDSPAACSDDEDEQQPAAEQQLPRTRARHDLVRLAGPTSSCPQLLQRSAPHGPPTRPAGPCCQDPRAWSLQA